MVDPVRVHGAWGFRGNEEMREGPRGQGKGKGRVRYTCKTFVKTFLSLVEAIPTPASPLAHQLLRTLQASPPSLATAWG